MLGGVPHWIRESERLFQGSTHYMLIRWPTYAMAIGDTFRHHSKVSVEMKTDFVQELHSKTRKVKKKINSDILLFRWTASNSALGNDPCWRYHESFCMGEIGMPLWMLSLSHSPTEQLREDSFVIMTSTKVSPHLAILMVPGWGRNTDRTALKLTCAWLIVSFL